MPHPIFAKYTRQWLFEVTGYTKGYLSRVATGNTPLSRSFIERVCFRLKELEVDLFSPDAPQLDQCLQPGGCGEGTLSQWLRKRLKEGNLTLREAAIKTGLSHATIAHIRNNGTASPESIKKLAVAFGGLGQEGKVLEAKLFALAGYRSNRPEEEEYSETMARLIDKVKSFTEPQLEMMLSFADFIKEIEGKIQLSPKKIKKIQKDIAKAAALKEALELNKEEQSHR